MRPNQTVPASGPIESMRQEVERRMLRGERFTDVEDAISSSDCSADEKAALWLLGWSYVHPRAQRREANAHLAALTAATPRPTTNHRRRLRVVP
jgi:hypothetical protein